MKNRDKFLFAVPLLIGVLLIALVSMLFWQLAHFESSYLREAEGEIRMRTDLIARLIAPMIEQKQWDELRTFCASLRQQETRVTVIDPAGKVVAESRESPESLGNHLNRPEVRNALSGKTGSVTRFSSTMNTWMLYYALKVPSPQGDYILRVSIETRHMSQMLTRAKWNIMLAVFLGAGIVTLLSVYILHRVRHPLNRLLITTERVAKGNLNTPVFIPESGIVRDLALAVDSMATQLRSKINEVTHENAEREAVFNAMSEAVLLIEPSGNVIKWNRAAASIFRIPAGQKEFDISRSASPELIAYVRSALESADSSPCEAKEITLETPSRTLILLLNSVRIDSREQSCLLLSITDLTTLRKLESFRSDFIANVSHEIKTPLTGILSSVEMLEDGAIQKPELASKCMTILSKQAKRLNSLVLDILSLAALERKQLEGDRDFAPVLLEDVIGNSVGLCREQARMAGIELKSSLVSCPPLQGNAQLLEQAVSNLIVNAVKYSGSPVVEVNLQVENGQARISVRDYGVGIAAEHAERIFERFYRVHKERSRELGGTGLGLSIVKHIAQVHHGICTLDSAPGKGCCFTIALPLENHPA